METIKCELYNRLLELMNFVIIDYSDKIYDYCSKVDFEKLISKCIYTYCTGQQIQLQCW